MRVLSVVGARPNFMKLAPVDRALAKRGVEHVIVHTGQHYDPGMSDAFFEELWIPAPDHHLGVGSGSHAQQTAAVMQRLEPLLVELRPDLVLVYGDVNSTVAAALVAAKLQVRVGHVEAGLRSGDWTMPEEINRVVTDRLSDLLFLPSRDAAENLDAEGIPSERMHFVGNVMIDTLCWALPQARSLDPAARHGVADRPYAVVTLHRPSNVDDPAVLRELLDALSRLAGKLPVLFPVHPRTRKSIAGLRKLRGGGGGGGGRKLELLEPLGYLEMLGLVAGSALVITDSGGLQEETSFLGVPCITVRSSTERPITCTHGTNRLVLPRRDIVLAAAERALGGGRRSPARPVIERWDGQAAERIVAVVCDDARFEVDSAAASLPHAARRAMALPVPLGAS
ncbi:MAG TPA: UDP-N-acetylglucosamine 2-epimerase (non-hydrolyzing) [Gemmatimonadales bacterium]|nr:UDP-N-acetylglucosamine 2-epimerase (non-hydrolyzing) [Gemmatimonadales bacterium]